jgi:hypothetical protein
VCQHRDTEACTCHRTRSNSWPAPIGYDGTGALLYAWQQPAPPALVAAVEAVYDALEDRT